MCNPCVKSLLILTAHSASLREAFSQNIELMMLIFKGDLVFLESITCSFLP